MGIPNPVSSTQSSEVHYQRLGDDVEISFHGDNKGGTSIASKVFNNWKCKLIAGISFVGAVVTVITAAVVFGRNNSSNLPTELPGRNITVLGNATANGMPSVLDDHTPNEKLDIIKFNEGIIDAKIEQEAEIMSKYSVIFVDELAKPKLYKNQVKIFDDSFELMDKILSILTVLCIHDECDLEKPYLLKDNLYRNNLNLLLNRDDKIKQHKTVVTGNIAAYKTKAHESIIATAQDLAAIHNHLNDTQQQADAFAKLIDNDTSNQEVKLMLNTIEKNAEIILESFKESIKENIDKQVENIANLEEVIDTTLPIEIENLRLKLIEENECAIAGDSNHNSEDVFNGACNDIVETKVNSKFHTIAEVLRNVKKLQMLLKAAQDFDIRPYEAEAKISAIKQLMLEIPLTSEEQEQINNSANKILADIETVNEHIEKEISSSTKLAETFTQEDNEAINEYISSTIEKIKQNPQAIADKEKFYQLIKEVIKYDNPKPIPERSEKNAEISEAANKLLSDFLMMIV